MARTAEKPGPLLIILHDGGRRRWRTRIALYKLEARRAALAIRWHDYAAEPEVLEAYGIEPAARSALYAIDGDGAVFEGAAALALLWSALPSHRGLGHVLASPAASALAELCGRLMHLAEPRRGAPGRG